MPIVPDMIGLTVADIPRALAFYRLLGLDIADPAPGDPYVEVATPNGYRISFNALDMVKQIDGDHWVEPKGQRIGLAFKCDSPADVDSAYSAIVAAGYTGQKAPWDAFWGQRYAQVVDPDGSLVDLFAPLPGEE